MVKRKRVGFLFSYNENWIGGTYYLLNIINALNTLKDDKKPLVLLLTDDKNNINIVKDQTKYPYLEYIAFPIKLSIFQRAVNKVGYFFNFTVFEKDLKNPPIDFLYPSQHTNILGDSLKKIFWIPDFQEEFLPHFFSEKELVKRKNHKIDIAKNADIVVFSSEDAQSHFYKLYPNTNAKTFVIHFAVTHPDFSDLKINKVLKKYNLPNKYYFSPNQFWAHKDHLTVLKAVKLLKEQGIEIFIAFSGKHSDHRNKGYVDTLKDFIKGNNLEDNILFLGFIDRKEQLLILENSIAVVQPSLFEGWSTVVEDTKALNKHIILTDLPVHYEQIKKNCDFFERKNEKQLSNLLNKYFLKAPKEDSSDNYSLNIKKFGEEFMILVDNVTL